MAHTSQQNAHQFAGPYFPLPNSPHCPNNSGFSTPAQSYLPQPSVQMLSQELASTQRKLSRYTDLITNLYGELETIRNIVCHNCKERILPANLAKHLLSTSQIPTVAFAESHDVGTQRTAPRISPYSTAGASPFPSPNGHEVLCPGSQLTISCPASPIPATRYSPNVPSPSEIIEASPPLAKSVEGTANTSCNSIVVKPQWSAIYNSKIEQVLDVTFVHAFKHTTSVNAVRFSPDGNFLAAGLTHLLGRMQIYDVKTRSMKCILAEYSDKKILQIVWCVCFSPDGRYLVVGGTSGMIYIWEISKKRLRATFKGHNTDSAVRSLDVSPDGCLLVTGSSDGSVHVWKMRDGSSKPLTTKRSLFKSVRFCPNGRYVAASNVDQFLRIWDVRSGDMVGKWDGHGERIRCLAFAPNGEELVSGGCDGTVMSWDTGSLHALARLSPAGEGYVKEDGMLVGKNEKLKFDGHLGEVRTVAISPDGKWVITGSSDNRVHVWDMHTAVQHCTLEGHVNYVTSVDFSPVGNYIECGRFCDIVEL